MKTTLISTWIFCLSILLFAELNSVILEIKNRSCRIIYIKKIELDSLKFKKSDINEMVVKGKIDLRKHSELSKELTHHKIKEGETIKINLDDDKNYYFRVTDSIKRYGYFKKNLFLFSKKSDYFHSLINRKEMRRFLEKYSFRSLELGIDKIGSFLSLSIKDDNKNSYLLRNINLQYF